MSKPEFFSLFSAVWSRTLDFGDDWGEGKGNLSWLVADPRHRKVLARQCALISNDPAHYAAYIIAVDLSHRARSFPELIALYELFLEGGNKDDDIPASAFHLKATAKDKAVKEFAAAYRAYIHGDGSKRPSDKGTNDVIKALRKTSLAALKKQAGDVAAYYDQNANYDSNTPQGLKVKKYEPKDLTDKIAKSIKAARLTLRRAGYPADRVLGGL